MEGIEIKDRTWFLILDRSSLLSKTSGAFKLKTIMNCREMNLISKCNSC